ncbi:MAG: hypothetical protein WBM14_01305 [Terracidiphilus sp.]
MNSYFRLSYTWPETLKPYDTKSLNLPHSSPNASEFLLFSVRQGDEPFGVIVFAEKLNVPTRHTSGIRDGTDFLDRAIQTFDPKGNPKIISRRHFKNADGLAFEELDYVIDGEYASGITTQIGQFLIVFKCNARTAADLARMTESVIALHPLR